jgi:hypothetical protein
MRCAAWTRRWTRHNRKTRILACFRPIRAAKRGCPHSRRVLEGNRTTLGRYRLDWALFPLLELGHIVASVALTDISTALSPGLRRGFFYIDSVSAKVKCFSFIQDWVEKKVRRHMGRAQNRKGFGWKRWSRQWLYGNRRAVQRLPGSATMAESRPGPIGPISLEEKQTGERSARKSARCVRCGGGWKRGMVEMV